MRRRILVLMSLAVAAVAWHGGGHHMAVLAAVNALPPDVPAFFRAGADTVAHCSLDPDLMNGRATPELAATEAPDHYFHLEVLKGQPPPPTRYDLVAEMDGRGVKPRDMGLLPYAVMEWTERLTVAFAEHRKWPENRHIQTKCLVYAGVLGHYTTDLCQPLHTTIHHDGRVQPDGTVLFKGIHARVDGLLEAAVRDPAKATVGLEPEAFENLREGVLQEIDQSHSLVDKVYKFEAVLPNGTGANNVPRDVVDFGVERLRESARFTASIYLTAWRNSAKVQMPSWDEREP